MKPIVEAATIDSNTATVQQPSGDRLLTHPHNPRARDRNCIVEQDESAAEQSERQIAQDAITHDQHQKEKVAQTGNWR